MRSVHIQSLRSGRSVPSPVGLQAVADVAAAIQAGYYDVGIAAGVETMTANPMKWEGGVNPRVASSMQAQSCLIPMGMTSENVAEKWSISRETQVRFWFFFVFFLNLVCDILLRECFHEVTRREREKLLFKKSSVRHFFVRVFSRGDEARA